MKRTVFNSTEGKRDQTGCTATFRSSCLLENHFHTKITLSSSLVLSQSELKHRLSRNEGKKSLHIDWGYSQLGTFKNKSGHLVHSNKISRIIFGYSKQMGGGFAVTFNYLTGKISCASETDYISNLV